MRAAPPRRRRQLRAPDQLCSGTRHPSNATKRRAVARASIFECRVVGCDVLLVPRLFELPAARHRGRVVRSCHRYRAGVASPLTLFRGRFSPPDESSCALYTSTVWVPSDPGDTTTCSVTIPSSGIESPSRNDTSSSVTCRRAAHDARRRVPAPRSRRRERAPTVYAVVREPRHLCERDRALIHVARARESMAEQRMSGAFSYGLAWRLPASNRASSVRAGTDRSAARVRLASRPPSPLQSIR